MRRGEEKPNETLGERERSGETCCAAERRHYKKSDQSKDAAGLGYWMCFIWTSSSSSSSSLSSSFLFSPWILDLI